MNNKIRILIIGFGSIGKRHYRNLFQAGYQDIDFYDPKVIKYENRISLPEVSKKILANYGVVFICTPDNLHIKYALMAAQAGCHLFIEKPLSDSLKNVKKLRSIIKQKKLISFVACNMRFHPCLIKMKEMVNRGSLGKIYSIRNEFGHYLPAWRPGEDYQSIYKSGIILNDMHEFDLLFWLNNFKSVKSKTRISGNVSNLRGVGEDQAVVSFEFNNKVFGTVHCDYLQKKYSRSCKIVGEKGNLNWNFDDNIVWLENEKGRKMMAHYKSYKINESYLREIKYFMGCVINNTKTSNDVIRATAILEHVYE
ncbi:MAG: Gfo/Idh/MocA family oxidoreductase [Patescibacteria group bacterium]|jgi:predicted dehydrogenase|nr:Gfo/Idh/MocA family oxidoreductase [Patescibacteria group bacterium]